MAAVGADSTQPQEMSRRFGLDKTLTWRISRVVNEESAWGAVSHIPRRPSMQLFADALRRHGAPELQIEDLRTATDALEQFIELHAGDRETFEIMIAGSARQAGEKRMELFRREGYQANTAIWGVCARVQLAMRLMIPGHGDTLDLATVCGLLDFRRLRGDVPWAVATLSSWDSPSSTHLGANAIEGLSSERSTPIIPSYSSSPTPPLVSEREGEKLRLVLRPGPVGNTATANVLLGYVTRGVGSRFESYPGENGEHGVMLTTPAEWLVHDLMIHESLAFATDPTAHVYGSLPGGPQYPDPQSVELPVSSEVIHLGSPADTALPEFARYGDLVAQVMASMGYAPESFIGYRYRLRYPPIPAVSILRHRLDKQPVRP